MLEELKKLCNDYSYGIVTYDETIISDKTLYEVSCLDTIITTLLIIILIQDQKIKLDDSINIYLTGYSSDIRIINLLTHSSGLTKGKKIFEVGTNVSFDMYNIELLNLIIEKIYQRSREECATEYIFKPLNMVNTKYEGNTLYSNVTDLTNIIYMILHNGYFDSKNLIDQCYIDMLFTPLFVSEQNTRRTIGFIYGKSLISLKELVGEETIIDENFIFFIDRTNDFGYIIIGDKVDSLNFELYRILKKYDKIF